MGDFVDPKIREEIERKDASDAEKYNLDTSDPDYLAAQKRGRGEDEEFEESIRQIKEQRQARELKQQRLKEASSRKAAINRQVQTPEMQQTYRDFKDHKGYSDFSEERARARDNKEYMNKARALSNVAVDAAATSIKRGDIKGAITAGLKAAGEMGGQIATAKILQFMWENFYYVLPIFYIDFHFIMRYIAGSKLFCRLGQEWLMKGSGKAASGAQKASTAEQGLEAAKSSTTGAQATAGQTSGDLNKLADQIAEAPNKFLEIIEIAALMVCNLIIGAAIYLILIYIFIMTHPCQSAAIVTHSEGILKAFKSIGINCK
ncbi:MAG: hypothetical protein PHV78_03125 [Patescibacteria group bacterium]|nr:hypothetical protein [Patescibacteria group bacterium]MDD5121622.1 hypothetical protein [Patescibacteria group bacterium]MDD5221937.1 hypothetical protein [Patescibacteria group bacterium]MDD5396214.1 hypothetical protein [Patescibacteria group bacterium]